MERATPQRRRLRAFIEQRKYPCVKPCGFSLHSAPNSSHDTKVPEFAPSLRARVRQRHQLVRRGREVGGASKPTTANSPVAQRYRRGPENHSIPSRGTTVQETVSAVEIRTHVVEATRNLGAGADGHAPIARAIDLALIHLSPRYSSLLKKSWKHPG